MQKTLNASFEGEAKKKAIYVLNYRYRGGGGCKSQKGLEKNLNGLGWKKVADLTTCYAKSVTNDGDSDLHQNDIEKFLKEHTPTDPGAEVSYGISKYIPPNQRPDNYEGIYTLFDE